MRKLEEENQMRKPVAWKAADDIEIILEDGNKAMPRAELMQTLVDRRIVRGNTNAAREQYAEQAVRRGLELGYMRDEAGMIHWMPGARIGKRVREKKRTQIGSTEG